MKGDSRRVVGGKDVGNLSVGDDVERGERGLRNVTVWVLCQL